MGGFCFERRKNVNPVKNQMENFKYIYTFLSSFCNQGLSNQNGFFGGPNLAERSL
jgi:hypothetical protein